MELHEVAHDGESQAETPMVAGRAGIRLAEALEDARQELPANAHPRVAHHDPRLRAAALEAELDAPPVGRELDRIGEQVRGHLLEPAGVAAHEPDFGIHHGDEPNPLRVGRRPDGVDGGLHDRDEAQGCELEAQLPSGDA